jgi:hypothetical protein
MLMHVYRAHECTERYNFDTLLSPSEYFYLTADPAGIQARADPDREGDH